MEKLVTLENIEKFLASKNFSKNTSLNYTYDLRKFATFMENRDFNQQNLDIYKKTLQTSGLSDNAVRRKISSINQFIKYLYEEKTLDSLFIINQDNKRRQQKVELPSLVDTSKFYGQMTSVGHFIALLILEFGLSPSEIRQLKWSNFDMNFRLLTIEKNGVKRVLPISNKFILITKSITNANDVFSKSRQFLFNELKKFTDLTAKDLREQYILQQVKSGQTIGELASNLGLKSMTSLEKYYKK